MPTFEQELESSAELLKCGKISKEQGRAHARSLAWFRAHAAQLAEAGWTVPELYRVGTLSFPYSEWGPGWLTLWNNEKCEPRLGARGSIEFVLHEAGGDVVQTCRLEKSFLS
ncbi:MAG TPA: hypothetical protein DGF30_05860 [Desulfomicrobium sp.]|nr:hypothetical protein [Desulfomicrobium sp.]